MSLPPQLYVWLGNHYCGLLRYDNGQMAFTYDTEYVNASYATALSYALPLQAESFTPVISLSFFDGLLPEEDVRRRLARFLGLSHKNSYALLAAIGGECAGAVSLHIEPPHSTATHQDYAYRPLRDEEAAELLESLHNRPMLAGEEGIRLSGAGAQDKIMVAMQGDALALPLYGAPSTHIIKPLIKGLHDTVYNEYFCMQLAQRVGLPAPDTSLLHIGNQTYYMITRYDRVRQQGRGIERLHQEDMCQALHIAPQQKYEREGGPSITDCFTLLQHFITSGQMQGRARLELLKLCLFNLIIGNGDAHGKNMSLLYVAPQTVTLAPAYDILCTIIYESQYQPKTAMKYGGKYRFREIGLAQLEKLATDNGLAPAYVLKQYQLLCQAMSEQGRGLAKELNGNSLTASRVYDEIMQVIEARTTA